MAGCRVIAILNRSRTPCGGHAGESALAAAPVVDRLNPADYRDGEGLAGLLNVAVEHVVLEQRERAIPSRRCLLLTRRVSWILAGRAHAGCADGP